MSNKEADMLLVSKVQKGDKRAFDLLVKRYQHKMIGIIGRYVADSAMVHDIAQEAFIKAYRAIGKFRGDSAFYTWLFRIAINTAKNHLTAQARRPASSDIDNVEAEQFEHASGLRENASPERLIMRDQLEAVIMQAIAELPEETKLAITLREFEGMSYEEIAEVMHCPIGTVRSRIFRARAAVDEQVRACTGRSIDG